jgi:hypothetical protein
MKKISCLFVFCLLTVIAVGQSLGFSLSPNQQLIEDAVKDGLFIVRQNYQLQDITKETPTYYGWNNNPHFGTTYALGVKTVNGFYSDDKVFHPWNYDSHYNQYRSNNTLAPVISETNYRTLVSPAYAAMPFSKDSCTSIYDSYFVHVQNSVFKNKGFQVNNTNEEKNGWVVWAISEKSIATEDTIPVSLLIYKTELVFEEGKDRYEIKDPSTDKVIAGGIYVVPEVTAVGQITFRLSGLLLKIEGKWNVVRLESVSGDDSSNTPGNLTPVTREDNDSKKKKKKK